MDPEYPDLKFLFFFGHWFSRSLAFADGSHSTEADLQAHFTPATETDTQVAKVSGGGDGGASEHRHRRK